jgi:hypothetical protein
VGGVGRALDDVKPTRHERALVSTDDKGWKKRSVRRVRSFVPARDLRHVLPPSLRRSQAHRSHLHTGQLYIYYEYSKKTYKHPEHTEHTVTAVKVATTGPQLLQHPFRHQSIP